MNRSATTTDTFHNFSSSSEYCSL